MPYGHPASSGHGRRATAYRWTPSVLPPSSRQTRRSRRIPAVSTAIQEPPVKDMCSARRRIRRTQSRPTTRTVAPRPSAGVSRLFGKMAASLAKGLWEMVVDMLTTRQRVSDSYARIVSFFLAIAAMIHSPAFLALGGFMFLHRFLEWLSDMATEASLEEYEENKRRLCIHRKTSVNAPPTPEAIRQAWKAARGSLMGKLLAGTLLSDLEPVVDQSYLRAEDGTVVGRRPGLKGWLRENCPDMLPHYKALMSYKALADKLRMALGVEDPDTLADIIDFGDSTQLTGETTPGDVTLNGDETKNTDDMRGRGVKAIPESLRFRERFNLRKSHEKTVWKEIHSLFGNTTPKEESGGSRGRMGNDAKISVTADEMTMGNHAERRARMLAKTSVKSKVSEGAVREAMGDANMPVTMGALEAAVRERLGLCWMRRTGRARRAA